MSELFRCDLEINDERGAKKHQKQQNWAKILLEE